MIDFPFCQEDDWLFRIDKVKKKNDYNKYGVGHSSYFFLKKKLN